MVLRVGLRVVLSKILRILGILRIWIILGILRILAVILSVLCGSRLIIEIRIQIEKLLLLFGT